MKCDSNIFFKKRKEIERACTKHNVSPQVVKQFWSIYFKVRGDKNE